MNLAKKDGNFKKYIYLNRHLYAQYWKPKKGIPIL